MSVVFFCLRRLQTSASGAGGRGPDEAEPVRAVHVLDRCSHRDRPGRRGEAITVSVFI